VYQLDGGSYDLRLDTGTATVTLSIDDRVLEDHVTGEMPIVRWMNTLRLDVSGKHQRSWQWISA